MSEFSLVVKKMKHHINNTDPLANEVPEGPTMGTMDRIKIAEHESRNNIDLFI